MQGKNRNLKCHQKMYHEFGQFMSYDKKNPESMRFPTPT